MNKFNKYKSKRNFREIQSSYVFKTVLSFLNEKGKLNMIIYSKEMQRIFSVDINDYKKVSGKYKIGERNGKGKEFTIDTNRLIFEGEYLYGKKMGTESNMIKMVN